MHCFQVLLADTAPPSLFLTIPTSLLFPGNYYIPRQPLYVARSPHLQGFVATGVTQPADVLKTRLMNARSGEYKVQVTPLFTVVHLPLLALDRYTNVPPLQTLLHCVYHVSKLGPLAFFKVGPHSCSGRHISTHPLVSHNQYSHAPLLP